MSEYSLLEIVNERLRNKREFSTPKNYNRTFTPTAASVVIDGKVYGKCSRQYAIELSGIKREAPDNKGAWTFEFGEAFEEKFIEYMKRAGIYYADHVRFAFGFGPSNEYQISGEIDAIALIDGQFVIVELKTGHGQSFFKQHIAGYERNHQQILTYTLDPFIQAPKIDNLMQKLMYLYYGKNVLPSITGDSINESRMIYVARDMCIGAEYKTSLVERSLRHYPDVKYVERDGDGYIYTTVPIKPFAVEDVLDRFIYTANYVEKGILPPRDYNPQMTVEDIEKAFADGEISKSKRSNFLSGKEPARNWQCDYCPFLDICLNN